jgi:hypothetical protein
MIAPSLGDARSRALVALLRFLHGPVIVTSSEHHVRLLLPAMKLMLAAGNPLHPVAQAQLRRGGPKAQLDLVTIDVDEDRQGYPLLFDVHVRTKGRMQHLSACSLFLPRAGVSMLLGGYPADLSVGLCTDGLRLVPTPTLSPIDHMVGIGRGQAALALVTWGASIVHQLHRDMSDFD